MTTTDRLSGVQSVLGIKAPVRAATTGAITLSGQQTIDGVAVVAGDRVLVKNQATASENGIYDVATGAWTRSLDFNGAGEVAQGTGVFVAAGSANANQFYVLTTASPVIGSTSLNFALAAYTVDGAALKAANETITGNWTFSGNVTVGQFLIGSVPSAADKLPYGTAAGVWSETDFSAYGQALVAMADAAELLDNLSVYTAAEVDAAIAAEKFTSAAQSITSGGLLTIAHGFAAAPGSVAGWLICTTDNLGYTAGDRLLANFNSTLTSASTYNSVYADATNIYVRFSNQTNCFSAGNKATGAPGGLTNSSWSLILEARK